LKPIQVFSVDGCHSSCMRCKFRIFFCWAIFLITNRLTMVRFDHSDNSVPSVWPRTKSGSCRTHPKEVGIDLPD
jgi:hypothetical protein